MSATMILVKPPFSSLNKENCKLQFRKHLDASTDMPSSKKGSNAASANNAVANAFRNWREAAGDYLSRLLLKPVDKKSQAKEHASKASSNNLYFGTNDFDISFFNHEVRTPLNSVLGFLQLLEMGAYGEIPAEARHRLLIAQRNLGRIINLAEELLTMEKNGSVSLKLSIKQCKLIPVLKSTLEAVTEFASMAGIEIESNVEDAVIEADPDRLSQVFINIVSNAVKYSPNGSKIKISSVLHDGQVEIRVDDEGPGILASARESIFEPFCQFGTTETKGGVGLGLYIAKSIVNLHSGDIGVDSIRGKGSSFWVRLPVVSQPNQPVSEPETQERENLADVKYKSFGFGLPV